MTETPVGAGRSSYDLIDAEKLFAALDLETDTVFLDLACGRGDYTLEAAEYVTSDGVIYAVDLWEEGIAALRSEANARGLDYVRPQVADVSERIPVEDRAVDVCLIASALHDFVREGGHDAAIRELVRVLRPGGRLAVIEFKKVAGTPGPPVEVRLAPEEVKALLRGQGFDLTETIEVGPYHYLSMFVRVQNAEP
jgi:ubiquinone/menaquinone biosynthesis C-methylase UbiE